MAKPTFDEFWRNVQSSLPDVDLLSARRVYEENFGADAVLTQGPDFKTFRQNVNQVYPDLPKDEIKRVYEQTFDPGFLTEQKRALKRGYADAAKLVGRGLGAAGDWMALPGGQRGLGTTLQDLGESVKDYWSESGALNQPSVVEQNRAWYNPKKVATSLSEMTPGLVASFGAGGLGSVAGAGMGLARAGASGLGMLSGGTVGGALEGQGMYEQQLARGQDQATAMRQAMQHGLGTAALNAIPIGRFLRGTPGRVKQGLWEAGTEILEEPLGATITGDDPWKATVEGAKAVGPAAFLAGAFLGGGTQPSQGQQAKARANIEALRPEAAAVQPPAAVPPGPPPVAPPMAAPVQPETAAPPAPPPPPPPVTPREMPPAPEGEPVPGMRFPERAMEVVTARGTRVPVVPALVEMDALKTSSDPGYDASLQPRDRSQRASMQQQEREIAANLDPMRLRPAVDADRGAPTVRADGQVLSGNGRVNALRIAAQQYPEKYEQYRADLAAQGFPIEGMQRPVLVMQTTQQQDWRQFTKEANESATSRLSPVEAARSDASRLTEAELSLYQGGDINAAGNRDFVRAFVRTLPQGDRNAILDERGQLSAEGVRRIQAGLLARAYGGTEAADATIARTLESLDNNVRAVTGALVDAAPTFANLRAGMESGRVDPAMDISGRLAEAIELLSQTRNQGRSLEEVLGQQGLFGNLAPETEALLRAMHTPDLKRAIGRDKFANILRFYANQAGEQARTDQAGLFGANQALTPQALINQAMSVFTEPAAPPQETLFAFQGPPPGKPSTLGMPAVQGLVDEYLQRLPGAPPIRLVNHASELPVDVLRKLGPDISAAYDRNEATGETTVYVVADNIHDRFQLQRALAHEVVGHYGFINLMGDRWGWTVDQVNNLASRDPTVRGIAEYVDANYRGADNNVRAAEIVAHLAERSPRHPLIQRLVAQLRDWLRRHGFSVNMSYNDLVYLLGRSELGIRAQADATAGPGTLAMTAREMIVAERTNGRGQVQLPLKEPAKYAHYHNGLSNEARLELLEMRRDAEAFFPGFERSLQDIQDQVAPGAHRESVALEGRYGIPPLKGWDRIVEKVYAEEKGNPGALKDMARATVFGRNQAEIEAAIQAVLQRFGQAPGTSVRRTLLDNQPDPFGYADVKINIAGQNGRVYEVQFTTPELFDLKERGGHVFYEKAREITARAESQRRNPTQKELEQIALLAAQSRRHYQPGIDHWLASSGEARLPSRASTTPLAGSQPVGVSSSAVQPSGATMNLRTSNGAPSMVQGAQPGPGLNTLRDASDISTSSKGIIPQTPTTLASRLPPDQVEYLQKHPPGNAFQKANVILRHRLKQPTADGVFGGVVTKTRDGQYRAGLDQARQNKAGNWSRGWTWPSPATGESLEAATARMNQALAPAPQPEGDLFGQTPQKAPNPRRAYAGRKVNIGGSQLELDLETRPDTTPAQVKVGNAFLDSLIAYGDRVKGAKVLADAMTKDFVEQGFAPLVGRKLAGRSKADRIVDLATIAQVYRDPRVETLRVFVVKDGVIVAQTGLSQRLPGMVSIFGSRSGGFASTVNRMLRAHGVTKTDARNGYYLLHNHPSGAAYASEADINMTGRQAAIVKGFLGHVILDHKEYSAITARKVSGWGSVDLHVSNAIPLPQAESSYGRQTDNPRVPHFTIGQRAESSTTMGNIALAAANEMNDPNQSVLVATNSQGTVQAIGAFPTELLAAPIFTDMKGNLAKPERRTLKAMARLRRFRAAAGASGHLAVVTREPRRFTGYVKNQLVSDVVDVSDPNRPGSASEIESLELLMNGRQPEPAGLNIGRVRDTGAAVHSPGPPGALAKQLRVTPYSDGYAMPKVDVEVNPGADGIRRFAATLDAEETQQDQDEHEVGGKVVRNAKYLRYITDRAGDMYVWSAADQRHGPIMNGLKRAGAPLPSWSEDNPSAHDEAAEFGFIRVSDQKVEKFAYTRDNPDGSMQDDTYEPPTTLAQRMILRGEGYGGRPFKMDLEIEPDFSTLKRMYDELDWDSPAKLRFIDDLDGTRYVWNAEGMTHGPVYHALKKQGTNLRAWDGDWKGMAYPADSGFLNLLPGGKIGEVKYLDKGGDPESLTRRGVDQKYYASFDEYAASRRAAPATLAQVNDRTFHGEQGGVYQNRPLGELTDQEFQVLSATFDALQPALERQRRGGTVSWDATERNALDLVRNQFGITLEGLVNRKAGTAANAELLHAYGMILGNTVRTVDELAARVRQDGSYEAKLAFAAAIEKLSLLTAPTYGAMTEAGRALNILKKVAPLARSARAIVEGLGDGTDANITQLADVLGNAENFNEIIGIARATHEPQLWDKFYEFWINGLLSGGTTHAVNMISNALYQGMETAAATVGYAITPGTSLRAVGARLAALGDGVSLGVKNMMKAWTEQAPILNPMQKLETRHYRAIEGTKGDLIRTPGRALLAEDEFFKGVAYQMELAQGAMEIAIEQDPADPMRAYRNIMSNPLAYTELVERALAAADKLTFTTKMGPVATAMNQALLKSKVGKVIVPFVRTPLNIVKSSLEYMPVGAISKTTRDNLLGRGDKHDVALARGRMIVGTGLAYLVVQAAAQGLMSGAGPDDPGERQLLYRTGWQPYSVKWGDRWYRYNRFEPLGMLLGVAADMTEIAAVSDEKEMDVLASMLVTSFANNLGDKTFLRGISEFTQAYTDPARYGDKWVQSLSGTVIPTAVAQYAYAQDPFSREANTVIDAIRARIPGERQKLARRNDIAGEPIAGTGSVLGVATDPFRPSDVQRDPLSETMLKLGVFKRRPGKTLRNVKLSDEEYEDYSGYLGKIRQAQLGPMVQSPQFQQLVEQNPVAAAMLLERSWDTVSEQARVAYLYNHPQLLIKVQRARQDTGRAGQGSNYLQ